MLFLQRRGSKRPLILYVFALTALLFSCKKNDVVGQKADSEVEKKFFTISAATSPELKAVYDRIKRENDKDRFVTSFAKRAGYAQWEHAKVISFQAGLQTGRVSSHPESYVVYIPFVRNSEKNVTSCLVANVTGIDTTFTMLYSNQYTKYGFNKNNPNAWNAWDVFQIFAYFNHEVFEHDEFVILDRRLFKHKKGNGLTTVKLNSTNQSTNKNGRTLLQAVTLCATYTICDVWGDPDGGGGGYVRVNVGVKTCSQSHEETQCTTIYYQDPANYTGTYVQPTGGGGGSTPWSPPAGCEPGVEKVNNVLPPEDDPCSPPEGWVPANSTNASGYYYSRIAELSNYLYSGGKLVNPCDYVSSYLGLVQFQPPQTIKDKVSQIKQNYINAGRPEYSEPVYLQDIQDASSAVVNFDYFPIHIKQLPTINGVQWTAPQLFDYFRKNMNSFLDNSIATFAPYQDGVLDDSQLWSSTDPTGTFLHLDMIVDGSVVISKYQSSPTDSKMIATTVRTPLDGIHPVSGHRSWGIMTDPNGGYNFYTLGVDRVTGVFETVANTWAERTGIFESGFEAADRLWTSLQTKMMDWINANNGQVEMYAKKDYILRPQWVDVDSYLKGQIDLKTLLQRIGC